MANSDVFAFKNSGLDDFLFAEIGIELNGSGLTILSALARLGEDPWGKAAEWAAAPRATVVELLAADIARMPLPPGALAGAHATATRLARLLPRSPLAGRVDRNARMKPAQTAAIVLLACSLAAGLALSVAAQLRQPATPAGLSEAALPPR